MPMSGTKREPAPKTSASFTSWKLRLLKAAGADPRIPPTYFRFLVRVLEALNEETRIAMLGDEVIADEVPGFGQQSTRNRARRALAELGYLSYDAGQGSKVTRYRISDEPVPAIMAAIEHARERRTADREARREAFRQGRSKPAPVQGTKPVQPCKSHLSKPAPVQGVHLQGTPSPKGYRGQDVTRDACAPMPASAHAPTRADAGGILCTDCGAETQIEARNSPMEAYWPFCQECADRSEFPDRREIRSVDIQPKGDNTGALKQQAAAAQEAASAIDLLTKRTNDHIDELDLETRSIGQSTAAVIKLKLTHDLERAALKDGVEVTDAMRDSWDRLGNKLAESTIRLNESRRAFELMKEGQRELVSDFTTFADDLLFGGKKLEEAYQSLAKTLSGNALKAIISGEGPLAGILGTASLDKNQMGGVLGVKLNLSSLLGGSDGALQGPTLSGRTLDQESGSFFSNLFDGEKISKALGSGAESGIGGALSEFLKPRSGANGQSMGMMSSPLGGALGSAAIGGSIGYSSQSPLVGVLGGAAAGFAMSGGNPVGALVGAAAGGLGGLLGQSEAKAAAKKKLQEELQARKEALDAARPQIEALSIQFEGGSIGNLGKQLADAFSQMKQAAKTASDAGDRALADKLVQDYQIYAARMTAVFSDSFNGVAAEMEAGFGASGPFSQAVASVQQLGESLKGFLADSARLGNPAAVEVARQAATEGALSQLDAPKTLSATQTELARINGTAAGLNQVLKDLGYSADQAASIISARTTKALDALRDKFEDDLGRKINDAQGKSYLNDVADLLKEITSLNADAASVGGDLGQVQTYFQAAAQKIVDSSQLTGHAFGDLVGQFPELNGLVHEFNSALSDTSDALDAAASRAAGYQDRYFAATTDTGTEDGSLATFDRQAEKDRATEVKAGGRALVDLETAQAAERLKIVDDFAQKAADALNSRLKGYADRYFAATGDTTTLGGQLAAYDRQAEQEREDEVKAGGEAIAQLEQTQYAERLKIINDFNKQAADAQAQALATAQTAYETFAKNIKTYLDGLTAGSSSPLAPKDRLAAAQSQYDSQLALARGGDRDALDNITQYASNLLDASKAFNASNSAFQATFGQVQAQLTALPTQVSAEQFIVNAITDSKTAIVSATDAMRAELVAGLSANSPALVATALNGNFARLDTSVNGLLDYNEFLSGLGPLATSGEQQAARNIFNAIDANGDGQISQLEAANASSYRVENHTASTASNVDYSNIILSTLGTLLNNINGLNDAQLGTLGQIAALNASVSTYTSFIQQNTGYTNQLSGDQLRVMSDTYNISILELRNLQAANGRNGAAVYATGGWVAGPGTGTSDSIAARLSNGEFVVKAASAKLYGPLLEAMNDNAGAFAMPAVAMPVPVAGGMGDSAAMLAELRALRSEVASLRSENRQDSRMVASTTAAGARHVREGVDEQRAETRKAATDNRQAANKPRTAGTRVAG